MVTERSNKTLFWYEVAAFSLLIVLSWADELLGLPARLFGGPHVSSIPEACVETAVILAVGVPLMFHTKRVVARAFYFEGFMRVCSWCKKVDHRGDWLPVAEFFEQRFEIQTSHGMCPTCFAAHAGRINGGAA
jgi:hypothetical protein